MRLDADAKAALVPEIARRRARGETWEELAVTLPVSAGTALRIYKDAGEPPPPVDGGVPVQGMRVGGGGGAETDASVPDEGSAVPEPDAPLKAKAPATGPAAPADAAPYDWFTVDFDCGHRRFALAKNLRGESTCLSCAEARTFELETP